ncbi:MAG: aspartate/glutamate racemase family protein [Rhizobiaceae bacterium]|nr:aspartate/glutamate racemase family protein [Rhizobiaceae bacterium]
MHIGLIGGIGPAATIAYYGRLVAEFKAAQLPLELTIVHADVAVLGSNATNNNSGAQAEVFANHIRQLEGAGCDVATITALTGHFCFEETVKLSPLPLVSAIEPIDRYCKAQGIKSIGLLGSPPVLSSHLFGQLGNVKTVTPQTNMEALGNAYMEMAGSGECSADTRTRFLRAGTQMIEDQGADAILLAGTDLGLAFDDQDPGYPVIEALNIHVAELVALAS